MKPLHFCNEIPRFPKYEYILPNNHCVVTQQVYQLTNGIISKLRSYCAQKHHTGWPVYRYDQLSVTQWLALIHTISALTNTPKLHN